MSNREYPERPVMGVGGVVFIDGRVVLIKRRYPPLAGQWSLPGGAVEVGETLRDGLRRELREEIGIDTRVGPLVELLDRIFRDPDRRVRHHYVLADFLCQPVGGALRPGSDAAEVALADPGNLAPFALADEVLAVIARAPRVALTVSTAGATVAAVPACRSDARPAGMALILEADREFDMSRIAAVTGGLTAAVIVAAGDGRIAPAAASPRHPAS